MKPTMDGNPPASLQLMCNTIARWLTGPLATDPGWSEAEWRVFPQICRVHGVAPLLYRQLAGVGWLPEATGEWLQSQYGFNDRRVARMHRELQEILALFGRQGVPVMPMKGSVLSLTVYDDRALRPMADLDLLVSAQDLDRSAQLLARLGYQPRVRHWKHVEFLKPDNQAVVDPGCEHPDNPRRVEVHARCREQFAGPTVDLTSLLWAQARPGELLGQPVLLPSAGTLWMHLLVHLTYHAWQGRARLIQLVDLANLAAREAPPLADLLQIDARFIYPALLLWQRYLPVGENGALLATQRSRVSPGFRRWAAGLDLVTASHLSTAPAGLYLFKGLRFSQGSPLEVAQALRVALLPALDELALDHPRLARSRAPWLAYLLLPLDWVKRLLKRGRD